MIPGGVAEVPHNRSKVKLFSQVLLFAAPGTVAYKVLLSVGFSKQEYWSELLFSSPGDLPDPGMVPRSPALKADALPSEPLGKLGGVVLISSSPQSFTGGPGQDVTCELNKDILA